MLSCLMCLSCQSCTTELGMFTKSVAVLLNTADITVGPEVKIYPFSICELTKFTFFA